MVWQQASREELLDRAGLVDPELVEADVVGSVVLEWVAVCM